jgi:hypothetical protein
MVLGLEFFGEGRLFCDHGEHFIQQAFLYSLAFDLHLAALVQFLVDAVLELRNRLVELHLGALEQVLLDIVAVVSALALFLSGLADEARAKGLDVEGRFDKILFGYLGDDGLEVVDHVRIEELPCFELFEAFGHNEFPLLTRSLGTSGEMKRTFLVLLMRLARRDSRMMVICSLKFIPSNK